MDEAKVRDLLERYEQHCDDTFRGAKRQTADDLRYDPATVSSLYDFVERNTAEYGDYAVMLAAIKFNLKSDSDVISLWLDEFDKRDSEWRDKHHGEFLEFLEKTYQQGGGKGRVPTDAFDVFSDIYKDHTGHRPVVERVSPDVVVIVLEKV